MLASTLSARLENKATTNCIVVSRPGSGCNSMRAGGFLLLFITDVVKEVQTTKHQNMFISIMYTYKPQTAELYMLHIDLTVHTHTVCCT